jgi:hypothetical protein
VCQLTGEVDQGLNPPEPTINHTESRSGLRGTDLGASFQGPFSVTFFLFGDTVPVHPELHQIGDDSIAFETFPHSGDCIHLTFFFRPDNQHEYQSPDVPGVSLGLFETPTGGFFVPGATYVLFATKASGDPFAPHASVLARGDALPDNRLAFQKLFQFPTDQFVNVFPVLVGSDWRASEQPTQVLFFATGRYRQSVILARLNPDGTWPADIGDGMGLDPTHLQVTLDRWKAALADATAAVNGGNQEAPANNWIIHPLIDGCKSTVIV